MITAAAEAAAQGLLLLPPQLQTLHLSGCEKISLLSNTEAAAGEEWRGGLQRLCSLRRLSVAGCPEFLSNYSSPSSSSFFPFPACLQQLDLCSVKHMETLRALSNLTSLRTLNLARLEDSRDEGLWRLLAHGRLTKLTLFELPDFFAPRPHEDREVFSRSSKLLNLETDIGTGFLAVPICGLFSSTLTTLHLGFDKEVEQLTKDQEEALQLLTSLQELQLSWGAKLQRLPAGLHKLTNLKKLEIYFFPAIRSLPSLPSSLQELEIACCDAFKFLHNSLPTSLEKLIISDCKAIKSLPKDGLPRSMRELDVHWETSEELKWVCRKLIGTIPIVRA